MPINPVEGQPNIAPAENTVIRRDRRDNILAANTLQTRTDAIETQNRSQRIVTQQDRTRADWLEMQRSADRNQIVERIQAKAEKNAQEISRRNTGTGTNMDIFG